jgi:hypothetical protein
MGSNRGRVGIHCRGQDGRSGSGGIWIHLRAEFAVLGATLAVGSAGTEGSGEPARPFVSGATSRSSSDRRCAVSASLGDVLAPARPGDVDADGVHRKAIEDRGGQGGVAEVAAPVAECDI